jgi:hypothetical protein
MNTYQKWLSLVLKRFEGIVPLGGFHSLSEEGIQGSCSLLLDLGSCINPRGRAFKIKQLVPLAADHRQPFKLH